MWANDKHRVSRENPDRSHLRDGECLRRPKEEVDASREHHS